MNDIEAAARRLAEAASDVSFRTFVQTNAPCDAPSSVRAFWRAQSDYASALAHAARGEGGPPPWHAPCVLCGHRQSAHNTDTGPCSKCGCDCAAFRPTPPPATGEECRWYTGNGEEYEILPPEEVRRRRIEAARRLRDVGPATGEAGMRGEVERVRAAVIDAAKAFRAHDETYLIANYENVAEEGERQRLIVKMLVAVDALLAAERSENGGDRG